MTPPEKRSMEDVVEGINFDRRSDHHDASQTHQYYPDANFCVECTEKNIAEALTQYASEKVKEAVLTMSHNEGFTMVRTEALEEAAKIADQGDNDSAECSWVADKIRAMKNL